MIFRASCLVYIAIGAFIASWSESPLMRFMGLIVIATWVVQLAWTREG